MANVIQQKFGTAAPASDALAKGELAIRFVAADHTASSSSKLYFGEGDSANLRQFGFGIAGDSGQHGIAIGENFTILLEKRRTSYYNSTKNRQITNKGIKQIKELI